MPQSPQKTIQILLKALKFYSVRVSFTHGDGKCSFMCKDEGDVAREAISRALRNE